MHDLERTPPCSISAEQAVLGGVMIDPTSIAKIHWLEPSDFYRADHRLIFAAMVAMAAADLVIDAVALADALDDKGHETGGLDYLIEIHQSTPSAANVTAYAEIVREKSALRQLIEKGMTLVNSGFASGGQGSRDIAATAARELLEMSSTAGARGPVGVSTIAAAWHHDLVQRLGGQGRRLLTPWGKLNKLTGGFSDGDLVVLAGRPSMGKSAVAMGTALCAAGQGRRTLIFSLEMTGIALFQRAVASFASVPLDFMRDPVEDSDNWARISSVMKPLRDMPLAIDETAGLTIDQIVMRSKREHMRSPLRLVVIDHMHIISLPGKNEVQELGEITRKAKGLAKALNCPVIVVAQLNRSLESRANKRPIMSDIRGSGNIEQDADAIIFVYRDDYYAQQDGRESEYPGMVELIVAKQREGQTGKAWARSALEYGRIDDLGGDDPRPIEQAQARQPKKLWKGHGGEYV